MKRIDYDDKEDLPKLYRRTAEKLNIAPSQHSAEVFKQVLGGCTLRELAPAVRWEVQKLLIRRQQAAGFVEAAGAGPL